MPAPALVARILTRATFQRAERRRLLRAGRTPHRAQYDDAGNCRNCGEAGRCPGWHDTPPPPTPNAPETQTALGL